MSDTASTATSDLATSAPPRLRVRIGWGIALMGLVVFIVGAKPEWFELDRSPVVGFVQIAVFLVGLGITCLGGYMGLSALWHKDERPIPADIGLRLIATGYVVCIFAGMADVFGLGSHPLPGVPFFGPWQSMGVQIGQAVILLGFLLFVPYRPPRDQQ